MADYGNWRAVTLDRIRGCSRRIRAALTLAVVLLLCGRPANAQGPVCAGCVPGNTPYGPVACGGAVGTVNPTVACSSNGTVETITAPGVAVPYICSACAFYNSTCGTPQQVMTWACGGNTVGSPGLTGCAACASTEQCCNGMCLPSPATCCLAGGACGAPNLACSDNANFPGCRPANAVDCLNGTYCPKGNVCPTGTGTTCSLPGGVSCGDGFCIGSTTCNLMNACRPTTNTDCNDGFSCPGLETCAGANQCCSKGPCPPGAFVPAVADTAPVTAVAPSNLTAAINTGNNPGAPAPYISGCGVSRSELPSGAGLQLSLLGLLVIAARRAARARTRAEPQRR
jgi:hypothetical protein